MYTFNTNWEVKQINASNSDTRIDVLTDTRRQQFRLQVNHKWSKSLELRNRVEWSFFESDDDKSVGFFIYQGHHI